MKRSTIFSLALFAIFAGSTAASFGYTDNMLPNAMPEGWEQAPYQIICDVEVNGQKVHAHRYRSFTDIATFPAWKVQIEGRDGKHLWIVISYKASETAPADTREYKHLNSGGWSEKAPDLTNFSDAEEDALNACVIKKARELEQTK